MLHISINKHLPLSVIQRLDTIDIYKNVHVHITLLIGASAVGFVTHIAHVGKVLRLLVALIDTFLRNFDIYIDGIYIGGGGGG